MSQEKGPSPYLWEVSVNGTLRDVFLTLEAGGMRIAVATDDNGRVVGIMTDATRGARSSPTVASTSRSRAW